MGRYAVESAGAPFCGPVVGCDLEPEGPATRGSCAKTSRPLSNASARSNRARLGGSADTRIG